MLKYIVGIIAVLAIIPALLPTEYVVERSIHIQLPKQSVYSYLVNLEDWKQWSPWIEKEPTAEQIFSGIPGIVGSSLEWKGTTIGAGKQTLTTLREPNYLEFDLVFTAPNPTTATGYFQLSDTEPTNTSKLTWGLKGPAPYPIGRVIGVFMGMMVGPDFERGLTRIKQRLEQPVQ